MTTQEYFTLLVRTSELGGFPAIDPGQEGRARPACQYRTSDGKKCAYGLLIPDGEYCADIDRTGTVGDVLQRYPHLARYTPDGMSVDDLRAVQDAHDALTRNPGPWDHAAFVASLKTLPCFAGCL